MEATKMLMLPHRHRILSNPTVLTWHVENMCRAERTGRKYGRCDSGWTGMCPSFLGSKLPSLFLLSSWASG